MLSDSVRTESYRDALLRTPLASPRLRPARYRLWDGNPEHVRGAGGGGPQRHHPREKDGGPGHAGQGEAGGAQAAAGEVRRDRVGEDGLLPAVRGDAGHRDRRPGQAPRPRRHDGAQQVHPRYLRGLRDGASAAQTIGATSGL